MVPPKWPSGLCISNLKNFHGILNEISLLKKYKKNIKFSNSLFHNMDINPCIFIYFISLDRHENQLLCGICYAYDTLGGV